MGVSPILRSPLTQQADGTACNGEPAYPVVEKNLDRSPDRDPADNDQALLHAHRPRRLRRCPRVTRSTLESCRMYSGAAAGATDGGVYIAVAAGAIVGAVSAAGDLTFTPLV